MTADPRRSLAVSALILAIVAGSSLTSADDEATTPPRRPDMTDPAICLIVRGFRDFDAFDEPVPTLSRDEKLQIYYEPFNYLIVRDSDDGPYRAHLVQDIRIRRTGNPRTLQSEKGVIDYAPRSNDPPSATYLHTTLSLKEFPPGEYEIDVILHDRLAEDSAESVRTLPFRVTPVGEDR